MDSDWVFSEEMCHPSCGSTFGLQMLPQSIGGSTQFSTGPVDYFEFEIWDGVMAKLESEKAAAREDNEAPNNYINYYTTQNSGAEIRDGGSQGPPNAVDYYESEMERFLQCNVAVAGPDQDEAPETSFAAMSSFSDMMEPRVDYITQDMIIEARLLASKMMGKVFYEEMEANGSSILPELLSSLASSFPGSFTVETFKKEAVKWVYAYMRSQYRKVAAHPQHIKDVPNSWRLQNPESFYPSEKDLEEIAKDTGLEKRQVSNLFENDRKRNLKKNSELEGKLKSHFASHITKLLRGWQAENHPRTQPNNKEQKALIKKTGLNQRQIADWFNNHKVGRNRSKKRNFEPFEL
ncbi:unnamed protein product [Calypogeia fissa]